MTDTEKVFLILAFLFVSVVWIRGWAKTQEDLLANEYGYYLTPR